MNASSQPNAIELDPTPQLSWSRKVGLLLLTVILLSLALAPLHQFYLAWFALVPWLFVVRDARSQKAAFLWSWIGGSLFFAANMWWLWKVTIPGMFILLFYLGLYFGFAALVFRGCGLIRATTRGSIVGSIFTMPMAWVAFEYVRGNWSMFGQQGLPWLNLGATQSKFLMMCQIADIGGIYAVSFWLVMTNVAVFFVIVNRRSISRIIPAIAIVASLFIAIGIYGIVRTKDEPVRPGPTVVVIQPNWEQSNSGEKSVALEKRVEFHVQTTRAALAECVKNGVKVDLVAWSETMMPPINRETREFFNAMDYKVFQNAHDAIANLASEERVALLVGGEYGSAWSIRDGYGVTKDHRNSAYFFESTGVLSDRRYDKVHLVPFGEFIPYSSIPTIYNFLLKLGPKYYEDYVLTPGDVNADPVFIMEDGHRFVVPICFEDIVGPDTARLVRGENGTKRADFLINITNDGWFGGFEQQQHIDAAIFRSIENRVPTARSVNTGVSGFIDSNGAIHDTIAPHTSGWSVSRLQIDPRVTFYTQYGDAFAAGCGGATSLMIGMALVKRATVKRATKIRTTK